MDTKQLIPAWSVRASCVGSGLDFFELHESNKVKLRAVCAKCSVASECLHFALYERQDEGLWAGTTPVERREMLDADTSSASRKIRSDMAKYARHGESA